MTTHASVITSFVALDVISPLVLQFTEATCNGVVHPRVQVDFGRGVVDCFNFDNKLVKRYVIASDIVETPLDSKITWPMVF